MNKIFTISMALLLLSVAPIMATTINEMTTADKLENNLHQWAINPTVENLFYMIISIGYSITELRMKEDWIPRSQVKHCGGMKIVDKIVYTDNEPEQLTMEEILEIIDLNSDGRWDQYDGMFLGDCMGSASNECLAADLDEDGDVDQDDAQIFGSNVQLYNNY